ncbi:PREDICTED: uncharacterized protein LOC105969236 [Erythranthe guttata]|uniref:uncharacterized protein LOC105969236 n=1 Tax=Erythranthe guttata TaxID=4155 RepID=UPI00064D9310|nr:PREDICTED: uncharacterized protein LOC105969236 [Erythranthe guttata]|eukprot:XP_012849440.1 PREDICTED: uncharacterized protein LOC105969236 [Erythranthe guttata]
MNYGSSSNQFDWVAYNEQILEEDNEADTLARLHYEAAVNQEVVHDGSVPGRKYKPRDRKETTATETLREFCKTILWLYKDEYLCAPTNADMTRLLDKAERRGFPGMIGSLDCMHWTWKNCPTAWQGSFSGRKHKPTIFLEVVASSDTWIWHAFFGVPDSQNDITILGRSPLFDNLVQGISPRVHCQVNEKDHYMAYYLADGIYPKWGTLRQSIKQPRTHQKQLF